MGPAGLALALVRSMRAVFIVAICLVVAGCMRTTDLPPVPSINHFLDLIG